MEACAGRCRRLGRFLTDNIAGDTNQRGATCRGVVAIAVELNQVVTISADRMSGVIYRVIADVALEGQERVEVRGYAAKRRVHPQPSPFAGRHDDLRGCWRFRSGWLELLPLTRASPAGSHPASAQNVAGSVAECLCLPMT